VICVFDALQTERLGCQRRYDTGLTDRDIAKVWRYLNVSSGVIFTSGHTMALRPTSWKAYLLWPSRGRMCGLRVADAVERRRRVEMRRSWGNTCSRSRRGMPMRSSPWQRPGWWWGRRRRGPRSPHSSLSSPGCRPPAARGCWRLRWRSWPIAIRLWLRRRRRRTCAQSAPSTQFKQIENAQKSSRRSGKSKKLLKQTQELFHKSVLVWNKNARM